MMEVVGGGNSRLVLGRFQAIQNDTNLFLSKFDYITIAWTNLAYPR